MTPRPARLDEAEALAALAAQIPGAPHWSVGTYRDLAVNPLRLLLVLAHPGQKPFAYAAAALIAPAPAEAELEAIAVHPSAQRLGYGRLLLQSVQQWAVQRGATRCLLEVRASSDVAQRMYAAAGFVPIGSRRNYYQAPNEDAVLMEWTPLDKSAEEPETSGIIEGAYGS